jgi:anti-sigma factor RsiW
MRCPTANQENAELLLAHASRTLDAERAAVLEEHMARCPACRDYYAAQLAVWAALDGWEAPAVSADFDRRLYGRIETASRPWDFAGVFRAMFGLRAVPLAAAVCLMAGAVWLGRSGAPGPVAPATSAAVQALPPDQAENTLQEMEMIQEFSSLVQADSADPRM